MTLPTETPTTAESLSAHYLAKSIAASPTFQTWTGAADAAEAEAFIWIGVIERDDMLARPYVIIDPQDTTYEAVAAGVRTYHDTTGTVWYEFCASIPSSDPPGDYRDDHSAALRWFRNLVGGVMDDVRELAGVAGYLNVTDHESPSPLINTETDEIDIAPGMYAIGEVSWR